MSQALPRLIVTGASGTVGRQFLEVARDLYRITAIARRSQSRAGIPSHPNVRWIQLDIGNESSVKAVTRYLQKQGGADFILHLAAYYDFEYVDHPEYERTNVNGTRHVLDMARALEVRRFVFASSLAACAFPAPGASLTEASVADAGFPYARSKRAGEELVRQYADRFPCSIVRLAAVFSDWGEFAPLYVFLGTWLSHRWNAHVLGGRGETAVPYVHSRDLNRLFFTLLRRSAELPDLGVYLATPDGSTSHAELFETATRFYFGSACRPWRMPWPLAWAGVVVRDVLGRLIRRRPFERTWMIRYLDRRLEADASQTRQELGWAPTPRFHVLRRVLFLVEKMKNSPDEWTHRNEMAMRRPPVRPALAIHDAMVSDKEPLTERITATMLSAERAGHFPHYQMMSAGELRRYVRIVYELIMAAIRTGDRTLLLNYVHELVRRRFDSGFPPSEVCRALTIIDELIADALLKRPALQPFRDQVHDRLTLTIRLAIDGVHDAYEDLAAELLSRHTGPADAVTLTSGELDLDRVVEELNAVYGPAANEPNGR